MKKRKEVSNAFIMCKAIDYVAFVQKDENNSEILLFNGLDKIESIYESAFRMYTNKHCLLFQNYEGGPIKRYDGETHNFLNQECYMSKITHNKIIVSLKENDKYTDYILNSDMALLEIPFFPNYANENFLVDHWDKHTIKKQDIQLGQSWQIDISTYGQYINLKGDTQPNEIDGELMGYNNFLFVPLRGGQLLALDAETGEKVWMLEQKISGRYEIYKEKIYKSNADALYEIDGTTGEILKLKDERVEQFALKKAGPMNVYEDIIILSDMFDGMLYLIDRATFKLIDEVSVGKRLVSNNDSIIWHNNTLYVLDIENTLHIFEKDK